MKKMMILAIIASCFNLANAQVSFRVKGGINAADVAGKGVEGTKTLLGFNAGVQAGFKLSNTFSINPELVYSMQGAKVPVEVQGEGDEILTVTGKVHLNYLNVPVLVKYQHRSGFFAEAGPQFGFLLSARLKANDIKSDMKDDFKKFDMGSTIGIGFLTKWNVGVNARYQLGLTKLNNASSTSDGDAKAYNSVLQLGVFYVLR